MGLTVCAGESLELPRKERLWSGCQEMLSLFPSIFRADPDADLVRAARAGDTQAFDTLVRRYHLRGLSFVRSRLNSAIDADDVAQEVFVAAWHELKSFKGRALFRTWLFGVAWKLCAAASRKHQRRREELTDSDDEKLTSAGAPDPALEALTEEAAVRQHLSGLADGEREILELYYYGDLNLREISELLSVNLNTVKYRFYQAHKRLESAFRDDERLIGDVDRAGR